MKKLIMLALLATSCSPSVILRTQVVVVEPPQALLVCPDLPVPPPEPVTDQANALFEIQLARAAIVCHSTVDAIRANIAKQKADIQAHPVRDVPVN